MAQFNDKWVFEVPEELTEVSLVLLPRVCLRTWLSSSRAIEES
jgi:hypothetical protein